LLPTGKILFWGYDGASYLWDPATEAAPTQSAQPSRNVFCSGHSSLADGRLLVSGGQNENPAEEIALRSASYYDPFTNAWIAVPDMIPNGRWYPSSTTLANGDVLVTAGSFGPNGSCNNDRPQVYQVATNSWRDLMDARLVTVPTYPRTFLAPNGRVFFATSTSRYLDIGGTGAWTFVANKLNPGSDDYGSAAMYDAGKVIFCGGGDPPTAHCETIDLSAPTPAWDATAPMANRRRQLNLTLLPDGKVLATGGSSAAGSNSDPNGAVLAAEVWDPSTGTWTTWAAATRYRGYHSTATLLPDGRVVSSGGDENPNAEVFSPPYLFNGPRPTITSAPASVGFGHPFFVATPDATSITEVTWTRLGSSTHAQDWNQRINFLSFARTIGGLSVAAPANAALCPPGHYLLWIINGSGVPSLAKIVQVSAPPPTPPPSPVSLWWSAVQYLLEE
jgi:hypothetical protein